MSTMRRRRSGGGVARPRDWTRVSMSWSWRASDSCVAGVADLVAEQVDVADAHRHHQVAGPGQLGDAVGHRVVARLVDDLLGGQRRSGR